LSLIGCPLFALAVVFGSWKPTAPPARPKTTGAGSKSSKANPQQSAEEAAKAEKTAIRKINTDELLALIAADVTKALTTCE
jgi:hypothetical protein